ncbi:MAG: hypothetical protein AABX62_01215, partial [Thermoproteota archaeon]
MTQIRTCYTTIVAENPGVVGTVRLRVLLEARGAPNIEVDENGTNNREGSPAEQHNRSQDRG